MKKDTTLTALVPKGLSQRLEHNQSQALSIFSRLFSTSIATDLFSQSPGAAIHNVKTENSFVVLRALRGKRLQLPL
jgi:hypothetical protein